MDLLPKKIFRLIRPLVVRKNVVQWHLNKLEHHTNIFAVALPVAVMTGTIIGLGVLIIDKQRELSHYRHVSVGTREYKLKEQHDQLVAFMKQAVPDSKDEIQNQPILKLPDS